MLTYEKLPNENPSKQPEAGTYFAIITSAEVRESQTSFKPYLNVGYSLYDSKGTFKGIMYDIFTEGPKEIPLFKIKRFIDALGIEIKGDFDLYDLTEKAYGKIIIVDTRIRRDSDPPRLEADVFKGEVYYNISKSEEIMECKMPENIINEIPVAPNKVYTAIDGIGEEMPIGDDMPF